MINDIINRFLHSRSCLLAMAVITIIASTAAHNSGLAINPDIYYGLAFQAPDKWISSGTLSLAVNLILNFLAAFMLLSISRTYNTTRSQSAFAATMFLAMQTGSPVLLTKFFGGTLEIIILLTITYLLFSLYQNNSNPRRIFLIFFLISLGALSLHTLAFYIPAVLLGIAQMRIFNVRSVGAVILGIITPLWILIGAGIITLSDFVLPEIESVFRIDTTPNLMIIVVTASGTILLGLAFIMMNAIKMLTYNARIRSANGFLTVLLVTSMIFAIADFNDIAIYLPTINWLTAYQAGHFFTTSNGRHNYIGALFIIILYAGLFIWNMNL